jgi:hypothetical protein
MASICTAAVVATVAMESLGISMATAVTAAMAVWLLHRRKAMGLPVLRETTRHKHSAEATGMTGPTTYYGLAMAVPDNLA